MRVRDFEPGDQDEVRDLIQAGLRERWGDDFDPAMNPDTGDIWGHYVLAGGQFVVAESEDGSIIGTGALVPEPAVGSRIRRMSVDSSHRRQGVARAIVAELLDRARQRGSERLVVSTDTPWVEAVALYDSCGFTVTHVDDTDTHFEREIF